MSTLVRGSCENILLLRREPTFNDNDNEKLVIIDTSGQVFF